MDCSAPLSMRITSPTTRVGHKREQDIAMASHHRCLPAVLGRDHGGTHDDRGLDLSIFDGRILATAVGSCRRVDRGAPGAYRVLQAAVGRR